MREMGRGAGRRWEGDPPKLSMNENVIMKHVHVCDEKQCW